MGSTAARFCYADIFLHMLSAAPRSLAANLSAQLCRVALPFGFAALPFGFAALPFGFAALPFGFTA
ncbi:hypothetical protein ACU21_05070 [Actinobaculum suis]|nr:hypothetical protein ACU19_00920 [Actinobaculum suis]OCA95317.1 hypothetical protein ACU21_05070 [Actinobaculum suis]